MEKRITSLISLFALIAMYLIIRFPLFNMHGMKQCPLIFLIIGVLVIAISELAFNNKFLPVFTVLGYSAGFFIGYFFKTDSYDPGGGALNNMWII